MQSAQPAQGAFARARDLSLVDFLERELNRGAQKQGHGWRFSACPNPACGESKRQASQKLEVRADDAHWQCYSCGAAGSIADAAGLLWGLDPLTAATQLIGGSRGTPVLRTAATVSSEEKRAEKNRKAQVFREVFARLHEALQAYRTEESCMRYLVDDRAIPEEVIRSAQDAGMLAFMPPKANQAKRVLVEAVGEDLLHSCGLWKPEKKLPGVAFRPLVFFMPQLSSAEFRIIGNAQEGWSKSVRYGVMEQPYWWPGVGWRAAIVEGFIDMLSMVALGFRGPILGLPGIESFKMNPEWLRILAARHDVREYAVCFDNDVDDPKNPGQRAAGEIEAQLKEDGLAFIRRLPPPGDINDILRQRRSS